jgi:hypothetical protein
VSIDKLSRKKLTGTLNKKVIFLPFSPKKRLGERQEGIFVKICRKQKEEKNLDS